MEKLVKRSLLVLFASLLVFSFSSFALADMTGKDFVNEAKKEIKEISVEQAKKDIDAKMQRGLLEFKVEKKLPDKNAYIILQCKTGGRSALATQTLQKMGYKNVVSMAGGWKAWVKAGYPVE